MTVTDAEGTPAPRQWGASDLVPRVMLDDLPVVIGRLRRQAEEAAGGPVGSLIEYRSYVSEDEHPALGEDEWSMPRTAARVLAHFREARPRPEPAPFILGGGADVYIAPLGTPPPGATQADGDPDAPAPGEPVGEWTYLGTTADPRPRRRAPLAVRALGIGLTAAAVWLALLYLASRVLS